MRGSATACQLCVVAHASLPAGRHLARRGRPYPGPRLPPRLPATPARLNGGFVLEILRRHPGNTHLGLMLALTFTTGIVDAVGYLGLDRVFTGNMTGNVVILGMGLAGADGLPVVGPAIALLAFVGGAALAGRLARDSRVGWSATTSVLLTVVTVVLGTTAALAFAGDHLVAVDGHVL